MSHTDQHLTVVTHPLVQHKLTLMRRTDTSTASFRQLLREISLLLAYEVTRDLPMTTTRIDTPMQPMDAPAIEGKKLALVSILRAGNGLLDGILELIPSARVGFVGLYRDPETLQPVEYYFKVPSHLDERLTIAVDPMLATGNSSVAAIDMLKKAGAKDIIFLCLLAAPEGVARMKEASSPPRSTSGSAITAISCPDWGMRVTGCSVPSSGMLYTKAAL